MKRLSCLVFVLSLVSGTWADGLAVDVSVSCDRPGEWTFETEVREESADVRTVRVTAVAPRESQPPEFKVVCAFPQLDCPNVWNPNFGCAENLSFLPWWGYLFNVARAQPLRCWFNDADENRVTLAAGELRRDVRQGGGLREEDFRFYHEFTFFSGTKEPLRRYETEIRVDVRPVPFDEAIRAAADWQARRAGGSPAAVPESAWDPVYSTWYGFHKDVTAAEVEAECAEAAKLGMKVLILDDGWQCDDIERSYQSCGDWRISKRRFPDMRGHVARIHALGMKYMVWFSVPFVGERTEVYRLLKDKTLRYAPDIKTWVLDPRFPEVRAYLKDVYLRCLRDWDIDGFKLDFIDAFGMEGETDPAIAQNYAGRDCRAISEGVEKLLKEVTEALTAEKPGLMFEFRQAYTGPVIRRYGTMVRVGDCPGSLVRNRVHIANMRLMCEGTSVHSDMLRWNEDESPENAQRFILNSIFGTVQYSVMLRRATPETKAMIARWIRFASEHRETLLRGRLRPHRPALNYPVVEAESEHERIVVRYDPAVSFELGEITKPTLVIDGETGEIATYGTEPSRTESATVYAFDRPVDGWEKEYAGEGFSLKEWWMGPEIKGEHKWATQSLPIGNGWFGVSVFGWVEHERLQVTHKALHIDPIWPDASMRGKPTLTNTEELETLPKLTDALELRLDFPHAFEKVSDYRRTLSLDEAVAEVAYTADGVRYTRTYFMSYPDKVLVARLTADRPGALTFGVRAVNPYPMAQRTGCVAAADGCIAAEQHFEAFNCDFAARVRVRTDAAGRVTARDDGTLAVTGATEATLVLACDTNWTFDPEIFRTGCAKTDPRLKDRVAKTAEMAISKGFAGLAKTHREDYRALYDRVELNLPKDDPTAVAAERAFNFGRYLLIASSRPGTLPANLQGTWNALPQAPWAGGVWYNINVQMNYWPAFPCNLAECFEPYVHFLETLQPAAHAAALQYLAQYPTHRRLPAPEAGLWNLGTGVIPWRTAIPGGHSGPGTGGLTTKLLWDSWDFTRDPAALARAYPLLRGLADFDTRAVDLTNGVYLSIFSASPEQRRANFLSGEAPSGAKGCYTTVGCAFDQQMIYENDRDFLRAHQLLGFPEDALAKAVREHLDRLDPVEIGADGQLKEFREENHYGEIGEKDHRHISHLCGLVPGEQINRQKTPEWAAAAERSLDLRGISGGWAAAHRVHCYARLGKGEKAYAQLKHYLENDVAPNGFHSHTLSDVPVFQIDANFGITAAIAEMLAQGDGEGNVDYLPALPAAWSKEGSFRGLVVRGGKVVSCAWRDGKIVSRCARDRP